MNKTDILLYMKDGGLPHAEDYFSVLKLVDGSYYIGFPFDEHLPCIAEFTVYMLGKGYTTPPIIKSRLASMEPYQIALLDLDTKVLCHAKNNHIIYAHAGPISTGFGEDKPIDRPHKRRRAYEPPKVDYSQEGKNPPVKEGIFGGFSDGHHTFDELYAHRTKLFCVICNSNPEKAWKSHKHSDGSTTGDKFLAGIETDEGQFTYHCAEVYWKDFKCKAVPKAPKYDGHTSDDIDRLFSLLQ
jgi:hypothetical protein